MLGVARPLLIVVVCLVAAWPPHVRAQTESAPIEESEQVVLSGDLLIPKGRVVGEVVVFHGSATVQGVVRGDVVVVDGPVTVSGQVAGAVVALDGNVKLLPTAQVSGDVMGGDRIRVGEGAQVRGTVRQNVRFTLSGPLAALGILVTAFAMAASTLVLGLLLLLIAPRGADRIASASRTAPLASFGVGLLATLVLPAAAVALVASILGLPLGLTVLLALGFALLVGYTWSIWCVGRAIVREPRSRALAMLAGWGIGTVIGLVPLLNVVGWVVGSVFGLGAMIVAAWRARGHGRHRVGGVPAGEPLPVAAEQ